MKECSSMGDSSDFLFIYGTLLPTLCRHDALHGAPCVGPARVRACLHDLGEYPALVPGDGVVLGEVYAVDARLLAHLDAVEEVVPGDDAASLYLRRKIRLDALAPGLPEQAWTYVYNRSVADSPLIEGGDYRQHLRERGQPR
jgi:gamma-glutamylcyclotransferase (GGCT)/AIG2-like uncharacterized protein YtfP